MLKVIKKTQVNKDLFQFYMEDNSQPNKEFYAYVDTNGAFKSVAIINNETNTRRELKAYRLTKKYFDVVYSWIQEEALKEKREVEKEVEEMKKVAILKKVFNTICYGVDRNVDYAINNSNKLDFFSDMSEKRDLYESEKDEEKKIKLEKNLMDEVVEFYEVMLLSLLEKHKIKLKCFSSDCDGTLNIYVEDMKKKGYEVDFYNLGNSFNYEYEYYIMILRPIEKKSILQLIDMVMSEENKINDFDEVSFGTNLLDDLEKKLSDIFGSDETYNILNDIICKISIDKEDRLKIMDNMLTIKGIN